MGNAIVSLQGITQKHGQRILAATQEAAALTVLLSAFGRQQVIAPAVLDLSVVVHSYGRVLRRRVPENLQLALSRTRKPPPTSVPIACGWRKSGNFDTEFMSQRSSQGNPARLSKPFELRVLANMYAICWTAGSTKPTPSH